MDEPELECVRTCQGILLGEMYQSKLEAMGIPTLLKYESAGPVLGITVDGLGRVDVMVPRELAAEARLVLEDLPGEQGPEDGGEGPH
jgi:hypothetical protein